MKNMIAVLSLIASFASFASTVLVKNIKFPAPGAYIVTLQKPEGCTPQEYVGVVNSYQYGPNNKIFALLTSDVADNLARPTVCREGFHTATILVDVREGFGRNSTPFTLDVSTNNPDIARRFQGPVSVTRQPVSIGSALP